MTNLNVPFRELITHIVPGYIGFYLFTHLGNEPLWNRLDIVEKSMIGIFFGIIFAYALASWVSEIEYALLKKVVKINLPPHSLFWFYVSEKDREEAIRFFAYFWFYMLNALLFTLFLIIQCICGSKLQIHITTIVILDLICIFESIRRFIRWKEIVETIVNI